MTAGEPIDVRLAQPDDFDTVGEIIVAAYSHDGFLEPGDDYADVLADAGDRSERAELWVATADDIVVGSVTFCPPGSPYRQLAQDGEGEFRMLGVAPSARGRGVARALVEQCFERCRELGLGEMVLCSMATMTSAHSLYRSVGFMRDTSLDWDPVPGVTLSAFRARTDARP